MWPSRNPRCLKPIIRRPGRHLPFGETLARYNSP